MLDTLKSKFLFTKSYISSIDTLLVLYVSMFMWIGLDFPIAYDTPISHLSQSLLETIFFATYLA